MSAIMRSRPTAKGRVVGPGAFARDLFLAELARRNCDSAELARSSSAK